MYIYLIYYKLIKSPIHLNFIILLLVFDNTFHNNPAKKTYPTINSDKNIKNYRKYKIQI